MDALKTALAFAVLVAIAGCSTHKTTVQTSSGSSTVTTSDKDKTVTVETSEGTVAIGQTVDAAKLGAPVYPGAAPSDQGSITSKSATGSSMIAAFKTSDTFDKVYGYYKQQLPAGSEKGKVTSGDSSVASFQVGDESGPDQVTVQISADKIGETDILITHVTKTGATP
jgi:hypothetical protein